jgi:HPt (histidine-containing phosphotransfer) domain-containing protein
MTDQDEDEDEYEDEEQDLGRSYGGGGGGGGGGGTWAFFSRLFGPQSGGRASSASTGAGAPFFGGFSDEDDAAFDPFSEELCILRNELRAELWHSVNSEQSFFRSYSPGFALLACISAKKPPPLGDARTPLVEVRRFYAFFRSFKSTRSFKEQFPGGHYRWGDMFMREEAKLIEAKLIKLFVAEAQAADPRIAHAEAAKDAAKQHKAAAVAAAAHAAAKEAATAAAAAAAAAAAEAEAAALGKKEKELLRKEMQRARKRLRQAAGELAGIDELAAQLDLAALLRLGDDIESAGSADARAAAASAAHAHLLTKHS